MPISTILARPQLVTLRERDIDEERLDDLLDGRLFSPLETFLIFPVLNIQVVSV